MRTQRRYQRYYRRGTHNTAIANMDERLPSSHLVELRGQIRKEIETQEKIVNNTSHVIELKIR